MSTTKYIIALLGCFLTLGSSLVFAQWDKPKLQPPQSNTPTPINISSAPQLKPGLLGASQWYQGSLWSGQVPSITRQLPKDSAFIVNGNARFNSNVWIEHANPTTKGPVTRDTSFALGTNGPISANAVLSTSNVTAAGPVGVIASKYRKAGAIARIPACIDRRSGTIMACTEIR